MNQEMMMRSFAVALSVSALCVLTLCWPTIIVQASDDEAQCKAWVVQSIPTDMPHLSLVPGLLRSADVFRWLAGNSSRRLDIISQYWQLIARPNDPRSGDYGYSEDEMLRFGANHGHQVYQALQNAADRNITMRDPSNGRVPDCLYLYRLLQHSGVYPDYTDEASALALGRPNVENVTLLLKEWWGSGIVHAKVWISDSRDVYIGSANNDWKSLTQVKEVGVYLVGCPRIAEKVEVYFNSLWKLAHLNSSAHTELVSDHQWQTVRKVPCWSRFLQPKDRCRSPLPEYVKIEHVAGYPLLSDPDMFHVCIETSGRKCWTSQHQSSSYLSFAPPELLFDKYQSDEQGWIDTIKSVGNGETLRISSMDWLGQSEYMSQTVYWASLSSAISEVVYGKHAKVKLLVANWAHFIENTDMYLKALLYTNKLCSCDGGVEIKYYTVPGFNRTGAAKLSNGTASGNVYPGYTRVNHGKYAVSDVRGHVGTSNLVWDYFYTDAGVSFGTHDVGIVSQLQQVFDADWNSPYALPVEPFHQ